jgi:broad specificity phosphatase PhoE
LTTLFLVRHGETDWNATERCQGALDIPMNENGVRQAQEAGEALRHVVLDAAYTSTLGRARQTAAAVLGGSKLMATPVAGLSELSYGAWHGLRPDEWPDAAGARWHRDPWSMHFPGGESLAVLRDRVIPMFDRIVRRHAGQLVLIASHGHVNRLILLHALGTEPSGFWKIAQPNGCVTQLDLVHSGRTGETVQATARQLFPLPSRSEPAKTQ